MRGGRKAPPEAPVPPEGGVCPASAIDPDVDLRVPAQRAELAGRHRWTVLSAISLGGAVGATARHAASVLWPASGGGFPWALLAVNAVGCALIGVLMVLVGAGGRASRPLVRPFLGVGVLGGFTTFSTYAAGVVDLLEHGRVLPAAGYAAGTAAAALGGVWAGASATRACLAGERS
ncbi:fluoride efflux transporter FluC [Streptomyces sp. C10-9-1]|uniref:fluoride efflux transporter FluC n=1 Tax=Streptomyces sp. C10-9-1 TaxID=1859285 RepID=UPI003D748CA5